jgi:hypothetical protein
LAGESWSGVGAGGEEQGEEDEREGFHF